MAAAGELNIDSYKKALKAVEELDKKQKGLKKSTETLKSAWDGISSTIFGISGAEWFEAVPKTTEDIQKQMDMLSDMKKNLQSMGAELNKAFGESMKSSIEGNQELLNKFNNSFKGSTDIIYGSISKKIQLTGEEGIKMSEDLYKRIQEMSDKKQKFDDLTNEEQLKFVDDYKIKIEDIRDVEKEIQDSKENSEKLWKKIEASMTELSAIEDESLRKKFAIAMAEGDISKFVGEQGQKGIIVLKQLSQTNGEVAKMALEYLKVTGQVKEMEQELQKATKSQFSFTKGLEAMSRNLMQGIIKRIVEFDTALNKTQKDFGINMDANASKMTNLVISTSEFGMSIEDTTQFMGILSDTLKSTDFDVIADATKNLSSIQLATGISSENLASMAGELMRAGKSAKDIKDSMAFANVSAKMFGVNTKKVLESISRNIVKMRTMGFVGGEKSLARMAAQAERLGQNVDEIFNVAERTRTIEGAMNAAAELQLAGGSFANINPMDLLAAARKGPEELNKILTSMGKDIGSFNEKGEFKIDPVDSDRLRIVAEATGESMESLTNRIRKQAEDNKKLALIPDSVFSSAITGMEDMDAEMAKSSISDMLEVGKNGKIEIKADSQLAKMGFKPEDISNLSSEQIKNILEKKKLDDENIEEQARQNQSLMGSLTSFKDAILNVFTIIQPIISGLTTVLQWFGSLLRTDVGKWVIGLTVALMLLAKTKAIGRIADGVRGLKDGIGGFTRVFNKLGAQGVFSKIGRGAKGVFMGKGGKSPLGDTTSVVEDSSKIKPGAGAGLAGFAKMLGMTFKESAKFDLKGIAKFTLAITALLVPIAGIALAFGALGGDPMILAAMGLAIASMAVSIYLASKQKPNLKNVLILSIAMAIVGAALIPFAFAAKLLNGVDWGSALIAVGILTLVVVGLALIGAALTTSGIGMAGLYAMAIGLVLVGAALLLFGMSMVKLGEGMKIMSEIDWSFVLKMVPALMLLSVGLMGFSIAALFFANPISMLGMFAMIGILGLLNLVLAPLAESLEKGATSLETMATSVQKLNESLGKLDFDKLEKLKEISEGFATASMGGTALAGAMEKLASAISGGKNGGGGSGGTKTLVVQLKLPDGKIIQSQIIKDIDKVS